jgi:peroxiredoxin Q/BCP
MAFLKTGNQSPDFKAIDQDGNEVKLSSYKGKKIILYFYPKADTPGCTAESCNLRDNYSILLDKGYKIIGVSADSREKQKKFAEKFHLPFTLIPDVEKNIIKTYGAWGLKKMYGKEYEGILRTTYVIDESGKIEKIFEKIETNDHAKQILIAMQG